MDGPEIRAGRPSSGGGRSHEIHVRNRESAEVTGVLHVASFDDRTIVLDTDLGTLTMTGQDLQIKQLDLNDGRFSVDGLITSLEWTVARGAQAERGKGFFARILK